MFSTLINEVVLLFTPLNMNPTSQIQFSNLILGMFNDNIIGYFTLPVMSERIVSELSNKIKSRAECCIITSNFFKTGISG